MRHDFCRTVKYSLALTLAIAASYPAMAVDSPMLIGGGQIGGEHSSYGTLGVTAPLPGNSYGNGWVAQAASEAYTYRYLTNGQKVDASVWGGVATLGYEISGAEGWLGAYAGPSYHDTNLSPSSPGNRSSGGATTARLQLAGDHSFTSDWKINGVVNYDAFGTNSYNAYWTRVRVLYRISGNMYTGPQLIYQGDKNYNAWSAGITLVGIQLGKNSSIGFNVGASKTQDFSATPYAGLEFGVGF